MASPGFSGWHVLCPNRVNTRAAYGTLLELLGCAYTKRLVSDPHLGQIRSDQIRSDQIRSDQIRSDQIRSDQITSDHIRSHQIRSNQIRSDQIDHDLQ